MDRRKTGPFRYSKSELYVIVEVQVGEYTGEDDIVRIEDDYKRTK